MLYYQLLNFYLRHKMNALLTIVFVTFVFVDFHQADVFRSFADGDDEQRLVGKVEFLFDIFFVEGGDNDAVQPHLHSFEQHALGGNAQVDVQNFIFRSDAADDDEGFGFGALKRQVQFRKRAA